MNEALLGAQMMNLHTKRRTDGPGPKPVVTDGIRAELARKRELTMDDMVTLLKARHKIRTTKASVKTLLGLMLRNGEVEKETVAGVAVWRLAGAKA